MLKVDKKDFIGRNIELIRVEIGRGRGRTKKTFS